MWYQETCYKKKYLYDIALDLTVVQNGTCIFLCEYLVNAHVHWKCTKFLSHFYYIKDENVLLRSIWIPLLKSFFF